MCVQHDGAPRHPYVDVFNDFVQGLLSEHAPAGLGGGEGSQLLVARLVELLKV